MAIQDLREVQVFRGVSVDPPGDLVRLTIPNARLNEAMRMLDGRGLGRPGGVSLTSSLPDSFVPTHSSHLLERDTGEGSWEEMEMTICEDSNTSSPNTLIIMFLSGALATVGLATNALHLVIAGMLVAPGFMPITRISLSLVARHRGWRYGCADFLKAYFALVVGAAVTAGLLSAFGRDPLAVSSSYYVQTDWLFQYWTTFSLPALLGSAFAATAGAALVATKRSVFTSGVMIGLALVPTAALTAIYLVTGDPASAAKAALRFAVDVALVFALSVGLFLWARFHFHQRDMNLSAE